eukprot:949591-Pyramimonas_sp.AAC.1
MVTPTKWPEVPVWPKPGAAGRQGGGIPGASSFGNNDASAKSPFAAFAGPEELTISDLEQYIVLHRKSGNELQAV